MSKAKLQTAINSVNRRHAKGLNDDEQVFKMFSIARETKGYYVQPKYDSYELCTDLERLEDLTSNYGYWSKEVKAFNDILNTKGGWNYMTDLNTKLRSKLREVTA